jgi:hypothetical protein
MMNRFRNVVVLAACTVVGTATLAWAMTVVMPNTIRPKGMLLVNELGNVIFGPSAPAKVEVTNLPAAAGPSGCPAADIVTIGGASFGANPIYTVPAGKTLIIADLDLESGCGSDTILVSDGTGYVGSFRQSAHRSFALGLRMDAGRPINLVSALACSISGAISGCLVSGS